MSKVERIGVSLDKKLLSMFDQLITKQGYSNRSEAIRDLIRNRLSEEQLARPTSQAVAGVFLVYDHHSTKLSDNLVDLQHHHLLQVITSTHVHLDHDNCLEVIILKGKVKKIEKLGNNISSLKGVKPSRMNIMTTGEQLTEVFLDRSQDKRTLLLTQRSNWNKIERKCVLCNYRAKDYGQYSEKMD